MSKLAWVLETTSGEYRLLGKRIADDIDEVMRLASCGYEDKATAIEALKAIFSLLREHYEADTIQRMTDVVCAAVPVVNCRLFSGDMRGVPQPTGRAQVLNIDALGERLTELAACGR